MRKVPPAFRARGIQSVLVSKSKKLPLQISIAEPVSNKTGNPNQETLALLDIPLTTSSPEKNESLDAILGLRKTELLPVQNRTGGIFQRFV